MEGAFAGAEIRQVQGQVGVDDADQRDVGEMQSLGDHLRAEQDIDLAGAKIAQDAAVIFLALQRVGIHAHDAGVGKELVQGVFDFLRAQAGVADGRVAAGRVRDTLRGRLPRGRRYGSSSFCSCRW